MIPRQLQSSFLARALIVFLCVCPLLAIGQTLNITNDVQTYTTLPSTTVNMAGKSELRITGTSAPISGSIINLNSEDAWFFMTNIVPSTVVSTYLSQVRVNGVTAQLDTNCRVVQYGEGTVVIPQAASFAPLTVYEGKSFTGKSRALSQYVNYGWQELGTLNDAITSFKLKRGYTATLATEPNGTGTSVNYVAADGDLEIGLLPSSLNDNVSFIRVFPWRWVSKKGTCDTDPNALNAKWHYNWNISWNSAQNWEYTAIRQTRWWPGLDQDWKSRGVNHLLGFNEPNNPVEDAYTSLDNGSTDTAVAVWPDLLWTGLRVGAPAVTDGGKGWLWDFMNKAWAAGHRIDYVPIHYYQSYWNQNDPVNAANQLYNFLKEVHDVTGLPVWVTEFNNGANWTGNAPSFDQNKSIIEAMINKMDETWWIERYAVYSAVEETRQVYYNAGGFTPMGAMYRDHKSPIGYVQQVPASGVSAQAHFSFDGDLRDALVNGNDGMAVGSPTFTTGKYGQALTLDGTDDYIQLPGSLGDTNDFTFTGWVYWNGGGNWQRIFDFGNGGTDNYVFLTPKSSTNMMQFVIRRSGVDQLVETTVLPTIGAWTHVAVKIEDTTAKIFVNGVLRATKTGFTFDPGALNTQFNYIGKSQWPDPLFSGKLDDLRFFDYALSDSLIAQIAANGPPQFGANSYSDSATKQQQFTGSLASNVSGGVGAVTFSKAAGPAWLAVSPDGTLSGVPGANDVGVNRFLIRATDSIGALSSATLDISVSEPSGLVARYAFDGNANATVGTSNGTATGSPTYTTGRINQAINLDGTDDFVTLPAGVATTDEITIAAWFWRDSTAGWQRLFDFGTGTDQYMFLSPRSGSSNIHFGIKNNGAEQSLTTPSLPTGQWVHVAVTLGANVGKLYVNGVLKDTQAITIKPGDFPHEFNYIGESQWPDPLMDGRVDEFLIFNKVLDATQIAQLANSANVAPVFTSDPISAPSASAGQTYEQTIKGSATDANAGSTLTYSKASGPAWLTVSPNGRISGVPNGSDVGTNSFVVRVTDPSGLADDAALTIVVGNSTGLIAHHPFNNTSVDSIGGSTGMTVTGAPAYTDGYFDRAIAMDGVNDVVKLRSTLLNGVTDMTITARVRWDGGDNWQRLFDFGTGTNAYLFFTPKLGTVSRFVIKNGGGEQVLQGPALTAGDWASVAVTLIGNTGTLYINGVAVSSGSITIDPSAFSPTVNYIGDSQYTADPFFNGAIDDFRIYNRGLTPSEVTSFAVPPAPVAVSDSSYEAWAAGYPFPSGQDGFSMDPDGDKLTNGWESMLGYNPLIADAGILPASNMMTAAELGLGGNKSYLTLQARMKKRHLGVTVEPRAASTVAGLASPDAANHAHIAGTPVDDGEYEVVTYYSDISIEDAPDGNGFMELRLNFQ